MNALTEGGMSTDAKMSNIDTKSDSVYTEQNLPEPSSTTAAYNQLTNAQGNDDDIKGSTATDKDSANDNKEILRTTESEISEKKESAFINPLEGGIDKSHTNNIEQTTSVKPTTSETIKHTTMNSTTTESYDIKTDENMNTDKEYVNESDDKLNNSEIEVVHHKHRHHHGEYLGVMEETDINERNPQQDETIVINTKLDSEFKGIKAESSELDTEKTEEASEKSNMTSVDSSDQNNSSHVNGPETTTVGLHSLKAEIEDKYLETDKYSDKLPSLTNSKEPPNLNEMPPLPDMDNLPPLPSESLPPLPDISELPPLPSKELPPKLPPLPGKELSPLPDISGLPPLPDKDSDLTTLPDVDNLPTIQDEDLPPVPDKNEYTHVNLPNTENQPPGLPHLSNSDNLPSLSDKDLPPLPNKEKLAPLPNPDNIPSLSDKDLPPLPDKGKLAPLPDFGDLPPFPDLPQMPNIDKLTPQTESKTNAGIKNTRSDSEETSADIFILKSNVNIHKDNTGDNNVKLGGSDTNLILSEENLGSNVNVSDSSGSDKLHEETAERNYTWIASNWTEVRTLSNTQ